jgi:hypothetical protein
MFINYSFCYLIIADEVAEVKIEDQAGTKRSASEGFYLINTTLKALGHSFFIHMQQNNNKTIITL